MEYLNPHLTGKCGLLRLYVFLILLNNVHSIGHVSEYEYFSKICSLKLFLANLASFVILEQVFTPSLRSLFALASG